MTAPVALVTGGASGVGAATARMLSERGYRVAINYRSRAGEAADVAKDCGAPANAMTVAGDVSDDDTCQAMVAAVVDNWGRLDVLVCNAGTTQFTSLTNFEKQNAEDFHRIYAVNTIGAYQMVRAAAPHLRASGNGAIVNVSSIAGKNGNGSSLAYVASKGALNALTQALARLLAPEIRVNAVLPGLIDSGWFTDGGVKQETWEKLKDGYRRASALERFCAPEDVARSIVYLATDATHNTGELMIVDGGFLLGPRVKLTRD